jgi:hypothetical protein
MSCYRIRIGEKWKSIAVRGRDEWALLELKGTGELGCTLVHNPAPRWSRYIDNLRRLGVRIETIHEGHRGPPGRPLPRYILRSWVEVVKAGHEGAP